MTMGDSYCQRKERKMSRYKFKGYTITNCGYHQPDHCVWWEAVDENGEACFHGNTLREVEFMILDYEWEQKMRKKEEEIELLKESMPSGNAAAMREALIETQSAIARCMDILNKIPDTCGYGGLLDDAADELCALQEMHLKSALSAPLRNCDVGTPEEQARRMGAYCAFHGKDENGCYRCEKCKFMHVDRCELAWAQMPFEEGDEG